MLDVGCGCGATTLAAAHGVSEGEAVGIDLSEQMIERARQRALEGGVGNARFEVADAQTFHLAVPFDSNAHEWYSPTSIAIALVRRLFFPPPRMHVALDGYLGWEGLTSQATRNSQSAFLVRESNTRAASGAVRAVFST